MSGSLLEQKQETEQRENTVDTATEKLQKLELKTQGKWVQCTCTEVADQTKRLGFTFETFHDREEVKWFDVPDTLEGSEIKEFLDSVGYTASNVQLMEGDDFWWHIETGVIADSPPSRLYSVKSTVGEVYRRVAKSGAYSLFLTVTWILAYLIGLAVLGPLGAVIATLHFWHISTPMLERGPDNEVTWAVMGLGVVLSAVWINIVTTVFL